MSSSRRSFIRNVGLVSASLAVPAPLELLAQQAAAAIPPATAEHRRFPDGFLWGTATASYQVEGAAHEDGRGATIWDTFSHTAGKTFGGDTGDVADDFYHRYQADIDLMRSMGMKSFRFSVAWSRVFPAGTGQANPKGLDFYYRLIDSLLAAGIRPFCTLYHWDLPQALEDKGGWQSRETSLAYADYAGYVAGKLSDRVKDFMTMNEMRVFVDQGYGNGSHAPGLKLATKALAQTRHHAVLAHGLGVQAIRAQAKAGTRVGIADNTGIYVPVIEEARHIEAARKAMREENAMYMTVLQEGRYSDRYLKKLGADAPHFTPEELKVISSPIDFTGINVYAPQYVRADDSAQGYAVVPRPASFPHMASPWLYTAPEAIYWGPRHLADIWGVKEIYITENGTSAADTVAADGHVYDIDRVMFLRNYLTQLQRAVSSGVPVKGYFLWSLLDNFEWADGYEKRFGIVYVDFKTQQRTPKLSAEFYKAVVANNAVM